MTSGIPSTSPRNHFSFGVAFLTCAILCLSVDGSATTTFDDIDVTPQSALSGRTQHGYAEYRFTVTNHSKRRPHTVRLMLREEYAGPLRHLSRSVRVGPSSTATVSLFQPPLPLSVGAVRVFIDGKLQQKQGSLRGVPHSAVWYRYSGVPPSVLVSRGVRGDLSKSFSAEVSTRSRRREPPEFVSSEASAWSQNWLAYSRYDGIVVADADWQSMSTAIQTAITRYVECGGALLVLGSWNVPTSWQRWRDASASQDVYYPGFGECLVSAEADVSQFSQKQRERIAQSWARTQQAWRQVQSVADANRSFPVVAELKVPVRGMFILMVLFAIAIGPVNLIVLARKGRRIWMFWTVPLISALTCGAVVAYAFLAEGLGAHSRTEGITILDETSRRATTIGMTAFYSPITPGEGLHFSYETELTPQIRAEYWQREESEGDRTIDWTQHQHLAEGWIRARVPAHFMVRKSEMRRERLVFRQAADGSLAVVNGLGADIRRLWFADQNGQSYSAGHIKAGAEGVLGLNPGSTSVAIDELRNIYVSAWIGKMLSLEEFPRQFLHPGCYIAMLDGNPFIERGLEKTKASKATSIVYGITGGAADEG